MTPETRALLAADYDRHLRDEHRFEASLDLPLRLSEFLSDQELMDEYLQIIGFDSDQEYRETAAGYPEFLAVLATAEYHEHWNGGRK